MFLLFLFLCSQEENQHLVQELKKCQEQLRAKDEVDLQASRLQKVVLYATNESEFLILEGLQNIFW